MLRPGTVTVRRAVLPEDAGALNAIDTSVVTIQAYRIEEGGDTLCLERFDLPVAVEKRFPFLVGDGAPEDWEHGWIALLDGSVAGFAAWHYELWNSRAVLDHLYVDTPFRRRGIARMLVDHIAEEALEAGANNLWLETSHLNAPGVSAYLRMGFAWSGFDRTLYLGTPSAGDIALFLSRSLGRGTRA